MFITKIRSITEKIDNTPYINKIPSVVPSITSKIDNIPFISIIPSILAKVNDVPGIGDNIEDILDVGIPGLDFKLEDLKDIIELAIRDPFGAIDEALPAEVIELAEKLQVCVGQISELLDPLNVIYDLVLKHMPEVNLDFMPNLPDVNELLYKAAAIVLLPLKPAVELTCDEVLPIAISSVTTIMNGVSSRRRLTVEQKPNHNTSPDASHCPQNESWF